MEQKRTILAETKGFLCLILHAHLPFVRHPEHERFLEENWLFEAVCDTYLPLLEVMRGWRESRMEFRLTLTLSPTLCSMLLDPLLQDRCTRYINGRIELAEKEIYRTFWERSLHHLAEFYAARFRRLRDLYLDVERDVVAAFRQFQDLGLIEIITCGATHPVLPLFRDHPPTLRGQILAARDHYRACFGRDPRGIWLPECAYTPEIEPVLQEANIRWFVIDTHGLLQSKPSPRYGVFAPVFTRHGLAAFGRDLESAKQVWSRNEGFPGDPAYRDFYRDIGFDLDLDYLQPFLPAPQERSFTGIKYYRITGLTQNKLPYHPAIASETAARHAAHFLDARAAQVHRLSEAMDRPPIIVCPYDAELFGHWWFEGPQFLDVLFRRLAFDQHAIRPITPAAYLREYSTQQTAEPAPSSWGEGGYWRLWLNDTNEWIYPHLQIAQERMTELADRYPNPGPLAHRALRQAARELLLAQSSDWPFIMRTGSSPEYATRRLKDHLIRFLALYDQLTSGRIDEPRLRQFEAADNIFPDLDYRYWSSKPGITDPTP